MKDFDRQNVPDARNGSNGSTIDHPMKYLSVHTGQQSQGIVFAGNVFGRVGQRISAAEFGQFTDYVMAGNANDPANAPTKPTAASNRQTNGYGLKDLIGNVAELTRVVSLQMAALHQWVFSPRFQP